MVHPARNIPTEHGVPTRDRILAVARGLFASKGFEATTVRAIANECRVTDAAIYHHFPSKQAILEALFVQPRVDPLPAGDYDRERTIEALLRIFYRWLEEPDILRLLFLSGLSDDPPAPQFKARADSNYRRLLYPVLAPVCGAKTDLTIEVVNDYLTGFLLENVMAHGEGFPHVLQAPPARMQMTAFLRLALPESEGSGGSPPGCASSDPGKR